MDSAIHLLKFYPRSKKELHDRLALKGIPESDITEASDRLSAMGYLDDSKFAKEFACSWKRQGKGSTLIRNELRRKGVAYELIKESLDSLYENKDEEIEHLKQLALKKMKSLKHSMPETMTKKLIDYLARKGFQYSSITQALKMIRLSVGADDKTLIAN